MDYSANFVCMGIFRTRLIALLIAAIPAVSQAGPVVFYLSTGQSGGQPSIDSADETAWYSPTLGLPSVSGITFSTGSPAVAAFDPTADWLFGGGNFDMKAGSGIPYTPGTGDDPLLTLTLYDGGTDPVDIVDSITWTATEFCDYKATLGDACGQFSVDPAHSLPLYFTGDGTATGTLTPYAMQAGHNYTVILSSPADTTGSNQYFIKAPDVFTVEDAGGAPPPTDTTPEPATWLTLLGGACLFWLGRMRQFARLRPIDESLVTERTAV